MFVLSLFLFISMPSGSVIKVVKTANCLFYGMLIVVLLKKKAVGK
ncbi:hypothetical protein CKO_00096 [Citrobacter koseri ATCC BAA-895]|uniref:Uncharacterized protein n=1 Tax=Citrobacter koseri (strain ATCC BAA-895 / CDC 4225-83 / SGSC4696) TaxID=290338 RepID=A8ACR2_CITK8|nr:hypothetical protein CKO_00096 [Citrobacter koseri ATCC BAA-895]